MKKILSIFSVLAFAAAGSTAMAGSMDKATLVSPEGEYVTNVYNIAVAWNWEQINQWEGKGTPIEIAMAPAQVKLECELGTFTFSNLADQIPKVQSGDRLSFSLYEVPGLKDLDYNSMKGEIKVTYPAGIVQSTTDYEPNEEVTFTINVMDYMNSYTSVTPKPGNYTSDEMKDAQITLTYGDYTKLEKVESAGDVRVTYQNDQNNYQEQYTIPWSEVTVSGNVVSFNLVGEAPDNCELIVNLPVNCLIGDETAVGGSATLIYNIWNGLPDVTVLSKPSGVQDRTNPGKLKLTWDYQTIQPTEKGVYLLLWGFLNTNWSQYDNDPVYPEYWLESENGGIDNVLVFDFTELMSSIPMNNYYFSLPEGIVENENGQINKGASNPYERICFFEVANPFDGPGTKYVTQDDKIIFYYDYDEAPEVFYKSFSNNTATAPYIINEKGEMEQQFITDSTFTVNGNYDYYYYFDLDRDFPNGAISLVIPFGYFTVQTEDVMGNLQKQYLPELVIPLNKTTGVEMSIEDENAPIEYYNIQGQRVVNPQNGQLVIKRQGNKAQKIIVR